MKFLKVLVMFVLQKKTQKISIRLCCCLDRRPNRTQASSELQKCMLVLPLQPHQRCAPLSYRFETILLDSSRVFHPLKAVSLFLIQLLCN